MLNNVLKKMYFYKKNNNFVTKYMYTRSKTCEVLYCYKINATK